PFDVEVPVAQRHDDAVLGGGGYRQRRGDGIRLDGQGVVAGGGQRVRAPGEQAEAVVVDRGGLAVAQLRGARDRRAPVLGDDLVAQAHAEDGERGGEAVEQGVPEL